MKWKACSQALFAASLSRMLDWSNLQAFRRWKPYLVQFFNWTLPESSAPRLKQKKVRLGFIAKELGFIAKELALFELFLSLATAGTGKYFDFFWCVYQWRKLYLELQ